MAKKIVGYIKLQVASGPSQSFSADRPGPGSARS